MGHIDIYKFLSTLYKVYKTNNSELLKRLYYTTFGEGVHLDDIECEDDENKTCLFDELYDELIDRLLGTIQCVGCIVYCELDGTSFIISKGEDGEYLLNGEPVNEKYLDEVEYFYDLTFN